MNKELMKQSLEYKRAFDQAIDHNYMLKLSDYTRPMGIVDGPKWINGLPELIDELPDTLDRDVPVAEKYILALFAYANYLRYCAVEDEDA